MNTDGAPRSARQIWTVRTHLLRVALSFAVQGLALISLPAWAIPAPLRAVPEHPSLAIQSGSIMGGSAADEFSLIGINAAIAAGTTERIELLYGDRLGQPLKREPGFFHVTVDRGGRRVVIDLAQVHTTTVEPERLAALLGSSRYVASSEMTMDPVDLSTNITLLTKVPVKVRASLDSGSKGGAKAQSRVMLEIMAAKGAQ